MQTGPVPSMHERHRTLTDRIKQPSSLDSAHWADERPNPNLRTYAETAPVSTPHLGRRVNVDTFSGGTGVHLEPLGVATGKRRLSEPGSVSLESAPPRFSGCRQARHHTAAYRLAPWAPPFPIRAAKQARAEGGDNKTTSS